jgi:uncharacterized membrane protein
MFGFLKQKPKSFFSPQEQEKIVNAIREAEKNTSGEVRVFVESKCRFVNALDRAAEIFNALKMQQTAQRNATLVYVAMKDKQLAVLGDEGIYKKTGQLFWNNAVHTMLLQFNKQNFADGIAHVVHQIGEALTTYFPYDESSDKNELPDDIVFGK